MPRAVTARVLRRVALVAFVMAGGAAGCGASYPEYAQYAAAQGRPDGPWVSEACRLDDATGCATLCSHQVGDACNNVGASMELGGVIGADMSAAEEYRIACMFGSHGGCYNQDRINHGLSHLEATEARSAQLQRQVGAMTHAVAAQAAGQGPPNASGEVSAQGPGGGWRASFDACASGEPRGFFGVDLASRQGGVVLRVVPDPIEGTRARLLRAGSAPVALDARSCAALSANVLKTGTRIDTVTLLRGDVTLDCRLPDGTNLVARATFTDCQRSAAVDAALATAGGDGDAAGMPLLAERYDVPAIPPELRALRVSVRARVSGATVGGESPEAAERACRGSSEAFLRDLGFAVVEDGPGDVEAELACTGHVTLRDTGSELQIIRPQSDGVSVTLRARGRVVDTIPAGPPAVRCIAPGTPAERQATCSARLEQMSRARIAGLLAASKPLAALARERGRTAW